ncbi:hypothetical protein [Streptomyces sp. NPDC048248]|uniref:hypothetical protein n=1 Tax=Streptomyces sp. NPDC048248 TaxID=3365523 RepID=UPI00371B52DE
MFMYGDQNNTQPSLPALAEGGVELAEIEHCAPDGLPPDAVQAVIWSRQLPCAVARLWHNVRGGFEEFGRGARDSVTGAEGSEGSLGAFEQVGRRPM